MMAASQILSERATRPKRHKRNRLWFQVYNLSLCHIKNFDRRYFERSKFARVYHIISQTARLSRQVVLLSAQH